MFSNGMTRKDFLVRTIAAGVSATGLTHSLSAQESDSAALANTSETASGFYDVRRFGAKGNGSALDTPAINAAIEAAAQAGGGTVWMPAGKYLCYSIRLKSRVSLLLDAGATIIAASVPEEGTTTGGYDPAGPPQPWEKYQDFGHNHWRNSLIWGEDLHDVSIFGPGMIWGKGLSRGEQNEFPRPRARAQATRASR